MPKNIFLYHTRHLINTWVNLVVNSILSQRVSVRTLISWLLKQSACIVNVLNSRSDTQGTGHGSSVGSVSASYASGLVIDPNIRHILSWIFFLSITDSRRASFQLLVNYLWEACPGTVWLSNLPFRHDLSCLPLT